MANFVKAYCDLSKQYFGLMVDNGKVVDFYDIASDKAAILASDADFPNLETAPNLRPCFVCGSRRVGKCSCAKGKYSCNSSLNYRYQCIYCNHLHVFSKDEGAEVTDSNMVGKKIVLAQGQEVEISAIGGGSALEEILIGVGWDIAKFGERNMDLDSSVFVQSSTSQQYETIYFGNKLHPSGCVVHHGDNVVGGKNAGDEDSENINIYLKKVPADRDELYFVLNIYDCRDRHQTFSDVRNMYIRLKNAKTKQILVEYFPTGDMANKTAIVIARAYRKNGKWMFQAIGKTIRVDDIDDIHPHCHP